MRWLQDDDRLALEVWSTVVPLADTGLAPLALEALGLRLSRDQRRELVGRLALLAEHRVMMHQQQREREQSRSEARVARRHPRG